MSILKRFSDIMASNINALLDKMEDPSKMIDQVLRNLQDDLNKVKSETAGVMAEEARAKRELDECRAEINKMQDYAARAVKAGNDDDARKFLEKKSQLSSREVDMKKSYEFAASNAEKMKQMHNKLVSQIEELDARRDSVKAKIAAAKAQEKINKLGASVAGAQGNLSAFDRIEQKANRMMDEAEAMAQLNNQGEDKIDDLMDKYDTPQTSVEDELNALKSSLDNNVEEELAKLKRENE
jgi:phage shock protein A